MARGWVEGGRWSDIVVVLNLSFIVSYDSLPPPVSCEISDFIEYKNRKLGSLVFTFDSKIKKKKKKSLTRYIEVVLMRMTHIHLAK